MNSMYEEVEGECMGEIKWVNDWGEVLPIF